MLRTYPICPSKPAPRPEGLRSIIRRLEHELERSRAANRPLPAAATQPAGA